MVFCQNNLSTRSTISELKHLVRRAEHAGQPSKKTRVTTGCQSLDQLLPDRALVRGSLVEWLASGPGGGGLGSGASVLALMAAREACREGGALVVVDRDGTFYPPAAAAWQIDLQSTMVVRPESDKDEHWALDQALRCEHAAAVVAWPRRIDSRTFRRLQLAAKASGSIGLLVRPQAARCEPSWADVRLLVSPKASLEGWRLDVQLLKCRGGFGRGEIELEINDETGEIHEAYPGHLASQLAHSTANEHSA